MLARLVLAACVLAGAAQAQPGLVPDPAAWGAASRPSPGPARVIGGHALGCISGAVMLPPDGPGWQAVRLRRNRNWGHPQLIETLRQLASRAQAQGLPPLLIGDLGQPRGGPMPYGHASHQTGLDADIWLDVRPRPALTQVTREDPQVPSLVLPDESGTDPQRWQPQHALLIRLAAETPGVERVLVNHAIKRELCRVHAGEPWLRRVRPWRGHDAHMHIRIGCPAGQPGCQPQPPAPAGDGCDASLDWWLSAEARQRPPRPSGPPPRLPAACAGVLSAPAG